MIDEEVDALLGQPLDDRRDRRVVEVNGNALLRRIPRLGDDGSRRFLAVLPKNRRKGRGFEGWVLGCGCCAESCQRCQQRDITAQCHGLVSSRGAALTSATLAKSPKSA